MKPAKAPVCVRCQLRELECQLATAAHIVEMADHDLGLCYEYAAPVAIAEAEEEYRKASERCEQLARQIKRLRRTRGCPAATFAAGTWPQAAQCANLNACEALQ